MTTVQCTFDRHAAPILAILNDAILSSTALYDYKPRTMDSMTGWFEAKRRGNFPVLGLEDESGSLMGFSSYGTFRAFPAYKYTVEHSVYVDARFRRRGIARRLLRELIEEAGRQDYHVMVGCIDAQNTASIALHEKLGFKRCGTIREAGFKFGRWLDLALYQLTLSTPESPVGE
jgi:L-amino acid N-acyltransferase